MKKVIMVLLALLAFSAFAWALDGSVTFYWYMNDENVNFYRYQLDGEDPDGWTVVDSWTTEATFDFIDVSVVHEFHLQQSYDGENWSVSSVVYSDVVEEPVFDDIVDEEPVVDEIPLADDVVDDVPAEEPAVEEEAPAPKDNKQTEKTGFLMDLGVGYRDTIPSNLVPPTVGLDLSATTLFAKIGVFEFGFEFETSFYTTPDIVSDFAINKLYVGADALAMFNFNIGKKTDIYFGAGAGAVLRLIDLNSLTYGITGELGVRYFFADKFGIGAEAIGRKSMYETRDYTMLEAKLYLSFRN